MVIRCGESVLKYVFLHGLLLAGLAGVLSGCGGGGGGESPASSSAPVIHSFSASDYVSSGDLTAILRWNIAPGASDRLTCRVYVGDSQIPTALINECNSTSTATVTLEGDARWPVRLQVRDAHGGVDQASIQLFTGSAASEYDGGGSYVAGGTAGESAPVVRPVRFVVNTVDDTQDGLLDGRCADAHGRCSLRAAVMESNQVCSTQAAIPRQCDIVLPAGEYLMTSIGTDNGEQGIAGDINVSGHVVIEGDASAVTLINGNAEVFGDRVFRVSRIGRLTLRQMTISHARRGYNEDTANGGAIYNQGKLTLHNVVLSDNVADGYGGALYHVGTYLYVADSSFIDNAAIEGGAIVLAGVENTPSFIEASTITQNRASNRGGGIVIDAVARLTDVVIDENHSEKSAAGVYVGWNGVLTLQQGSISKNKAIVNVGALNGVGLHNAGRASLINTTLAENYGNTARCCELLGAAIYNRGQLSLSYSTVADNRLDFFGVAPITLDGAGIYSTEAASLALKGNLFARNYCGETLSNCRVSGSAVTSYGYNLFTSTAGCVIRAVTGDAIVSDDGLALGPLQDHGGRSNTLAIDMTSPAYNRQTSDTCTAIGGAAVSVDQRGQTRGDGGCDSGAFER